MNDYGIGSSLRVKLTACKYDSFKERRAKLPPPILPPTVEIAIYTENDHIRPTDETCAWGGVSSHKGDIRSCPRHGWMRRKPRVFSDSLGCFEIFFIVLFRWGGERTCGCYSGMRFI